MCEGSLYYNMDDSCLTDRQRWLKYEYIDKISELNGLFKQREDLTDRIIVLQEYLKWKGV